VVRNEKFQNFCNQAFDLLKEKKTENLEDFMNLPMGNLSVKDTLDSLSGVIGEKLGIKRLEILKTSGTVAGYFARWWKNRCIGRDRQTGPS